MTVRRPQTPGSHSSGSERHVGAIRCALRRRQASREAKRQGRTGKVRNSLRLRRNPRRRTVNVPLTARKLSNASTRLIARLPPQVVRLPACPAAQPPNARIRAARQHLAQVLPVPHPHGRRLLTPQAHVLPTEPARMRRRRGGPLGRIQTNVNARRGWAPSAPSSSMAGTVDASSRCGYSSSAFSL